MDHVDRARLTDPAVVEKRSLGSAGSATSETKASAPSVKGVGDVELLRASRRSLDDSLEATESLGGLLIVPAVGLHHDADVGGEARGPVLVGVSAPAVTVGRVAAAVGLVLCGDRVSIHGCRLT